MCNDNRPVCGENHSVERAMMEPVRCFETGPYTRDEVWELINVNLGRSEGEVAEIVVPSEIEPTVEYEDDWFDEDREDDSHLYNLGEAFQNAYIRFELITTPASHVDKLFQQYLRYQRESDL